VVAQPGIADKSAEKNEKGFVSMASVPNKQTSKQTNKKKTSAQFQYVFLFYLNTKLSSSLRDSGETRMFNEVTASVLSSTSNTTRKKMP